MKETYMVKNVNLENPGIINYPGFKFIKDIESNYVRISMDSANFLGWKSPKDAFYKTDYDIPSKVSELADKFIEMDKKIILTDQKIITMALVDSSAGWKLIVAEKNSYKNDRGEIIGTICTALDLTSTNIFKWGKLLTNGDKKILGKIPTIYRLDIDHSPLPLTPRQQECLFLLVRGKSTKEIADTLILSNRTVEAYIAAIKDRLNCYSRSKLIEKAIDSGFFYYLPKNLLGRYC